MVLRDAIGCQTPTRTGLQGPSRVALTPEHVGTDIRHGLVNEAHVLGQDRVHSFPAGSLRAGTGARRPHDNTKPKRCRSARTSSHATVVCAVL